MSIKHFTYFHPHKSYIKKSSFSSRYIRHVPKLENRLHLGTYSGSDCAVNINIDSYYQEKRL